ncbi:hypothetical protein Bpfe_029007 [Biomphalaria pfeifferi]|uniref:Uncharacterized protein n=1 Tax=Biomphalaria pfeifferi TaxID=112525 RepID=A0AAD8ATW6_BIOPF|nr:hypothetical protein Bpfe_029007 [Biomphalaria pfeifferi]
MALKVSAHEVYHPAFCLLGVNTAEGLPLPKDAPAARCVASKPPTAAPGQGHTDTVSLLGAVTWALL